MESLNNAVKTTSANAASLQPLVATCEVLRAAQPNESRAAVRGKSRVWLDFWQLKNQPKPTRRFSTCRPIRNFALPSKRTIICNADWLDGSRRWLALPTETLTSACRLLDVASSQLRRKRQSTRSWNNVASPRWLSEKKLVRLKRHPTTKRLRWSLRNSVQSLRGDAESVYFQRQLQRVSQDSPRREASAGPQISRLQFGLGFQERKGLTRLVLPTSAKQSAARRQN